MSPSENKTRLVPCPTCAGDSVFNSTNIYRPFCSARCKGIDLGAWASESFRVPEDTPANSEVFGDTKLIQ